jgi:hypothetical protein
MFQLAPPRCCTDVRRIGAPPSRTVASDRNWIYEMVSREIAERNRHQMRTRYAALLRQELSSRNAIYASTLGLPQATPMAICRERLQVLGRETGVRQLLRCEL